MVQPGPGLSAAAALPGARSRYLQLALIVLAAGAIYPILYLRQVYQTTMLEVLGINNTELGVLYSILGTSFLVSYLPSGWLADRIQPRLLIIFSLLGTGLLGLWYAALPGFTALLVIYCGFGITTGLTFWAATLKQVKLIAGHSEQGRFFGVLDGGRGLVEAVLASLAIALFVYATETRGAGLAAGFRDVVLMYAVACIAVGVGYAVASRGSARGEREIRMKRDTVADLKALLRIPEVWLVAAIIFCGYHVFLATYSFSGYLQEGGFGLSAAAAGFIVTVKLWLRPVGGIGGGFLGDRYSNTRVLFWSLVLAAASLVGMIALPGIGSSPILIGLLLLAGLLTYAIRGLYWAILDECGVPPEITGLAIGIISLVGYAPDTYLPIVNGIIVDRYPGIAGYQIYFGYVAVICVLGALATAGLMIRLKRKAAA
ncbi:MFS transporter [Inquilinus limosus MP06]|uniref:MFS transporter n=1 Tax=Inquilinus limosus MP06 TaxID=1398085 RepID=A0A0A0D647_9PROT|nr:MFS transporter [Inquilinus limosus MP06]